MLSKASEQTWEMFHDQNQVLLLQKGDSIQNTTQPNIWRRKLHIVERVLVQQIFKGKQKRGIMQFFSNYNATLLKKKQPLTSIISYWIELSITWN